MKSHTQDTVHPADSEVTIVSDGACTGNPGPGGWAALLRWRGHEKILTGNETHTTNNRMELMAVIAALEALKRPMRVVVITDSRYVQQGITTWMAHWKRNGWRTADNQPIKNVDLWKRLEAAAAKHHIDWQWVKGHSNHLDNERVDSLARSSIKI